jgi:hypothetical protein
MRLAFSRSPGGFRELREADGKHFHLSWHVYSELYLAFVAAFVWGQVLGLQPHMLSTLLGNGKEMRGVGDGLESCT